MRPEFVNRRPAVGPGLRDWNNTLGKENQWIVFVRLLMESQSHLEKRIVRVLESLSIPPGF
jgi:hypothetical protein